MTTEHKILDKILSPNGKTNITLYKNGDNPSIYYYFTLNKKSIRGSTGTDDLDSSKIKVTEIFYDFYKGLRKKGHHKTVRFEDVCKKFLKYKQDQNLSPRTYQEYKRQSLFLLERFKGREISSLCSKNEYLDYREWRRKYYFTHEKKSQLIYKRNGKVIKGRIFTNIGNVPINRECRLLVSILRFGKEFMGVLQNVEIPSYQLLPERRREEILTHEEYEKLREYFERVNPYNWLIISFVNNTGIRYPGELNRICWKDVNLEKSYVLIRDRKTKNMINDPLHTPVPLIGRSKEIIETLGSREGISKEPDDLVFVNDKGRQIKNIRKSFKKSIRECGIDKNLSMYSLRHLFTTRMVKRPDIPIKVLSEVLGHKDTTMINKFYSHLKVEDVVNIFQKSEDRRQEILEKQKSDQ